MTTADVPFQFMTASYITQIEANRATTLKELLESLQGSSDSAIFHHTFQTLGRHHYLTEGFSNDFAQWVLTGLNQPRLAERLASIDIRDYMSIQEVRADVRKIISEFCESNPGAADQIAFEPFYFCRAIEVIHPLPWEARTLPGFRAGLERLSHSSLYFHFIASRLRIQLGTNDFSRWFSDALHLDRLAREADRIDIYTNTLDSARCELIDIIDREIGS